MSTRSCTPSSSCGPNQLDASAFRPPSDCCYRPNRKRRTAKIPPMSDLCGLIWCAEPLHRGQPSIAVGSLPRPHEISERFCVLVCCRDNRKGGRYLVKLCERCGWGRRDRAKLSSELIPRRASTQLPPHDMRRMMSTVHPGLNMSIDRLSLNAGNDVNGKLAQFLTSPSHHSQVWLYQSIEHNCRYQYRSSRKE
jgi:hypothetical protein